MTYPLLAVLATLAGATPVGAGVPPPFAAPTLDEELGRYPVFTAVELAEPERSASYEYEPWKGGPDAPASIVEVGALAKDAWRRLVLGQLLAPPAGVAPDLELALVALRHGVPRAGSGWKARVDVQVVVRAQGVALDRLTVVGEARIGAGKDAVASAFAHAMAAAALASARAFDRSPGVGRWLEGRGLRQPAPPVRPDLLLVADVALVGLAPGGRAPVPVELQLGVAQPRWFARAVVGSRGERFGGKSTRLGQFHGSDDSLRLGGDAGFGWRIGPLWEAQIGAGFHWLHGEASSSAPGPALTISHDQVAGSFVTGFRWIPQRRYGSMRLRIGADLRLGLGAPVRLAAFDRTLDYVSALSLVIGLEPSPAP